MVSDNVKRGIEIINKYPEIFESLEEYDRTRRLRKIYHRKRLNVTIDENIFREFKSYARKKSLNISRFIENCMVNRMSQE